MRFILILPVMLAICFLLPASSAKGDCCKTSKILFKLTDNGQEHNCGTYGGKYHNHGTCEKKICGNGDGVVGTWCGRGKCNPRGCNCKNGCLQGDPIESFRNKHGFYNFDYVGYA